MMRLRSMSRLLCCLALAGALAACAPSGGNASRTATNDANATPATSAPRSTATAEDGAPTGDALTPITPSAGDDGAHAPDLAALTRFLAPYVMQRDIVPVGGQPDDDALWLLLHAIVYEYAQRSLFDMPGAVPELRPADPGESPTDMALAPDQFALAARDYLGWEIDAAAVTARYADQVGDGGLIELPLGDGEMNPLPCLTTCEREGDGWAITLAAVVLDIPHRQGRTALARVRVAPESIFGYTLGAYEDEPLVRSVRASSAKKGYPAENAVDGDYATAWVPEESVGGWLEIEFSRPILADALVWYPGYGKSEDLLRKNNRVRMASLTMGDAQDQWLVEDVLDTLMDEEHTLGGEEPLLISGLRLTIDEVFPGSAYDDTCISEVSVRPMYWDP